MKKHLTICFILPDSHRTPSGGHKMVFEYANRLAEKGYAVKILFNNLLLFKKYHLPEPIRQIIVRKITQYRPKWFDLDPRIEKFSSYDKQFSKKIADIDTVVFTAIETVYDNDVFFNCRNKLYFIQDYENWFYTDEMVKATYRKGFKNIVISRWLKDIVDTTSGKESYLIKNPIDLDVYRVMTPISTRRIHTIGLLYHKMERKGLKYAIEAIKRLKTMYSDLEVYSFGIYKRPKEFPSYIHYTENAFINGDGEYVFYY